MHHNLSWSKLRRGDARQYVQGQGVSHFFVRMSPCFRAGRYVCNILQEVVAKVAHIPVEAFALSGLNALRPMPHNLSWGLASARRRGHSVHEGRAHFLVLGEFCQVASEG